MTVILLPSTELWHHLFRYLIVFGTKNNCHNSERNVLMIKRVVKLIVVIIEVYHWYQSKTLSRILLSTSSYINEIIESHVRGFWHINQLLIRYSVLSKSWKEMEQWLSTSAICQLQESIWLRKEEFYNTHWIWHTHETN